MRALLVLLLVLAGLLVIADRVGVSVAEDQVAERVAAEGGLADAPVVDIEGFPFLTQAVSGRYEEVRVQLSAADTGQPEGTEADITLRGVEVPLSAALSGSVRQVPVERIDGSATLSYDLLAAQLGPGTVLERESDGLRITRTVELLGQQVPLTATGQVTVEGADLVVDVEGASGAGVEVPDLILQQAAGLLDLRYTVPPLPFGLQLTDVEPAADGVVVGLEARDAVLAAG